MEDDHGSNVGDTVQSLVERAYVDVDAGSVVGIAVVAIDRRNGDFVYRCDPADSYQVFIGGILENGAIFPDHPTQQKATLLAGTCEIKFLPNDHFNTEHDLTGALRPASDMPFIRYRGWDGTMFQSGQITVNSSMWNADALGPFSLATAEARLQIISINDPPEIDLGGLNAGFVTNFIEGSGPVPMVGSVRTADIDNSTWVLSEFRILNVLDPGLEEIQFMLPAASQVQATGYSFEDVAGSWFINISEQLNATSGELSVMLYGEAPRGAYELLIQSAHYVNLHPEPRNTTRQVTLDVSDRSTVVQRLIFVQVLLTLENAPNLTLAVQRLQYTESQVWFMHEGKGRRRRKKENSRDATT